MSSDHANKNSPKPEGVCARVQEKLRMATQNMRELVKSDEDEKEKIRSIVITLFR